jgi:hypothetical protein
MEMEKITVNGVKYVKEQDTNELQYVVVRTYSAGVFAGYLKSRNGKEVELTRARRIWYWDGACSLSQLAMEGVTNPDNCKFAMEVDVILTEAIEILQTADVARKIIQGVTIWKK